MLRIFLGCGYGAGPGGRISGSLGLELELELDFTCWRVTNHTAAVQVGKRSAPGMSSAARVGKKAQCHPRRRIRAKATIRSSSESAGDTPPSAKNGNATIWRASAAMATAQARRCSGAFSELK